MATGTEPGRSYPQPIPQASHRGAPAPNTASAVSPPSRRELASWWKKFRKTNEKDEEKVITAPGIFGVPLAESIRYANVAISLTNEQGESFIYGYVPIVVAKCGVFLKEKATDVEGIFRLSGSAKRIKDLQITFNSPDRYGKGLDWTGYTVHDAANILRRYLNQLPEPIVPLEQYERFRDPLRSYQQQLESHPEGEAPPEISAAEHANAVSSYQKLITELPALNRQLLLYILDLLAVFSSKSDLNRMTAANLAAIFQPGIISHPVHDMAPQEYRLSQDVLIFLIENQDHFLIGMSGTGLDEKTQKDVESGAPSLKSPKTNIGRSASNASAGADSLRKFGLRRNVSVSSHASRERTSPNVSTPGTPASPSYPPGPGSIGVARSNTVPSKRSPAIAQHRFQRVPDSTSPTSPVATHTSAEGTSSTSTPEKAPSTAENQAVPPTQENIKPPHTQRLHEAAIDPFPELPSEGTQTPHNTHPTNLGVPKSHTVGPPQPRDRKISMNLFSSKSPKVGPSDPQSASRQPRKLQKKQKLPGSNLESAQSSAASLQGDDPFQSPIAPPDTYNSPDGPIISGLGHSATVASAVPATQHHHDMTLATPLNSQETQSRGGGHQKSPAGSLRSGTSMTDPSDFDTLDDPVTKAEKKRNRWRFSSSAKRPDHDGALAPPPPIGQNPGARTSNSSVGSSGRPRQSFTAESHATHQVASDSSNVGQSSTFVHHGHEANDQPREGVTDAEKKGFLNKWMAKMTQSREERREREAEKERAKSPQRMTGDNTSSRHSLSAFAHDHFAQRGRSFDKPREDSASGSGGVAPAQTRVDSHSSIGAPTNATISQTVAPQTASVTAPAAPIPASASMPNSTPALAAVVGEVMESSPPSLPNSEGAGVVVGKPGPAVAPEVMPVVKEESTLEVNTTGGEAPQASSVQHTPTEIRGPILESK